MRNSLIILLAMMFCQTTYGQQAVLVAGAGQEVLNGATLRSVPPAKKNDPPQLALYVGEKRVSKAPIYLAKLYQFAVQENRYYINGYADDGEANLANFKSEISAHPVTVGHRGDNVHCPENTNISYATAIAKHTPIVEMDLRLTSDNVLVLLHDPTVDRTTATRGKKAIVDMTFADAQKLDAGAWKADQYKGERIPAVETIFQTCRGKAIAMLDLKCTGLGKYIADLKSKLNVASDQLILAPWVEAEGVELRKYLPDVPMILLHGTLPIATTDDAYFEKMKQIGFGGFSINWPIITKQFIDAAHKHGMKIYVWTVNEPVDIAGATLNGVDGIITDDPAATMKLIEGLR
jgi:glycerophosphoryl diester phosphodiesterase